MRKHLLFKTTRFRWIGIVAIALTLTGGYFLLQQLRGTKEIVEQEESKEDEYDGPGERLEFELERTRNPYTGKVPWDKFWVAVNETERMKTDISAGRIEATQALSWAERGPNGDFTGPQGNGRPNNDQTAGRIRAVMIDSLDPTHKTVWAGGVDGGLWKTTDITVSPATWSLVNDYFTNLSIAAIVQDPRPGFQNIMYFCTGESYGNADAVRGVGVFKSIDGGLTWNFLPSTSSYINGTKIVCDHLGNVYLGTRGAGLLRSVDGGATWQNITPTGLNNDICDIEISSTSGPGRLHVTHGIFSAAGYRYTDIPATVTSAGWTAATTPFTTFSQRTEFAVLGNTLYALPDNASHQVPNIWKSIDGGANWAITPGNPSGSWANGQGWYSLSVGINPANPDECIVGGLDCFKTTNGGSTWPRISGWVTSVFPQYVHADQHNVQWWDGGTKLLFACDGGIHYSSDGGAVIRDRNKGLRLKQFYSVAIHPLATNYFIGGTQDNGMHRLNHPGLDSSIEVVGGDGCYSAIDQDQPQFQFGSYVYNVYRRSINNGASWTTPVNNTSTGRFVNPWDYDNLNNRVYACNNTGTYLRWDNPQTGGTTAVVTCAQFGGNVSAVHVSPYTANRVFFGLGNGGITIVDDAHTGTTVTGTVITPTGASGYVNCVVTGVSDQNLIACYSSYGVTNVWVSTNGGTSWTASDGNLPDMPVRWALFHPDSDTKAFIATETGVWETDLLNGASTVWVPNTTFPNVRTDMIKYRASDRVIAAGTHGRGIWTATVAPPTGFSFDNPAPVIASCPAPSTMTATITASYIGGFSGTISLTSSGAPVGTNVSFGSTTLTPGSPSTTVNLNNANTLAPGSYVITVTGTATGAPTQNRNITFTINPGAGPTITGQPGNQAICTGGNTSFSVTAPGASAYQWQESTDGGTSWNNVSNGGVYSGATSATLSLTSVPITFNNYRYRAIVSGQCGNTTSSGGILTVSTGATISNHPQDITLCAASNHTFSVVASGTGLTYQWELSTDGATTWNNVLNGGVYSGATTADLLISGIMAGMNNYKYRVLITGSGGCTSPVTSNVATLTVVTSVAITSNPSDQTVCEGQNASFTVAGSGSGIVYQWQVSTDGGTTWNNVSNGGVYSGATTETLTITGATVSMNNYRYRAQLSNSTCTTPGTSTAATLTVNTLPGITTQPVNANACTGTNTSFTAAATGTGVALQWQVSTDGGSTWTNVTNGGVYSGATTGTLSLTGVTTGMNNNRYRLVATGTCAPAATSNAVTLAVVNPATITAQPANAEICSGSNTSFSVTASSTEPPIYQWQSSTDGGTTWNNIPGANAATYNVANASVALNNNRYRALVFNATCATAAISNAALLNVRALPVITLSAAPYTSLLPGQTTTLTASPSASTGGVLVTSWLFNGNTPVPPITGNSYVANIEKIGSYQVRITETWPSGLFCTALSQLVTIGATASPRLFIYPSPNDGTFTVSYYNSGGASTQRSIVIFDSKGSMVFNKKFTITGFYTLLHIDMRTASRGIYYVVVGDLSGNKLADGKVHIR